MKKTINVKNVDELEMMTAFENFTKEVLSSKSEEEGNDIMDNEIVEIIFKGKKLVLLTDLDMLEDFIDLIDNASYAQRLRRRGA